MGWQRLGRHSHTAARTVWTAIDQGLSSLTNFGVGIAIAHSASARDFGAFAIVFAAYLVALGVSRAISTEPLLVRVSAATPETRRSATRAATGLVLILGVGSGMLLAAAGLLVGSTTGRALVALAVCLPGLLLQDSWRWAFFADGRPASAAANDLVWTVLEMVLLGAALAVHVRSTPRLVLAWGVAGCAAGCAGMVQAKMLPRPAAAAAWLRTNRDLNVPFTAEFLVTIGTNQGLVLVLAAVAGLAETAKFAACALLLGPVNIVLQSAGFIGIPELARRVKINEPDVTRAVTLVSAGALVLTGAWLAFAAALPDDLGRNLFGKSWIGARQLLVPLALWAISASLMIGASCGLRALAAARATLRLRLILSLLALGLAIPFIELEAAYGAALALAVASLAVLPLSWIALIRALQTYSEAFILGDQPSSTTQRASGWT